VATISSQGGQGGQRDEMRIIDRYLSATIFRMTAIVLLVLLAQSGFVNLVDQLDEIGEGSFGTGDAFFVTVLMLPSIAFEIFPISVLLGTMLGLGSLANHSELIAIRAAGVSIWRFARVGLVAGFMLAAFATLIGEFVAPPAEQFARSHKAQLKDEKLGVSDLAGVWLRDGPRILNILQVQDDRHLAGILTFNFNDSGQLLTIGRAKNAVRKGDTTWQLNDYRATRVDGVVAEVEVMSEYTLKTSLASDVLEVSVVQPESLSVFDLWDYVKYLNSNGLDTIKYEMALWTRMANVAAVPFMVLLGLPFVFGPLRTGGNGIRLVVGMVIGILYYLANGALANTSAVYEIPAVVTAWIPVALLALVSGIGILRAR
jgi:lipopolysaccharide export system permease protein